MENIFILIMNNFCVLLRNLHFNFKHNLIEVILILEEKIEKS